MRPLFFLFKSEKKTDEGDLKQMRESLRNNLFLFGLTQLCSILIISLSEQMPQADWFA